jgi:hypothetical protein
MLRKFYIGLAAVSLLGFGVSAANGWELEQGERQFVPADVRHSPGGYRSFHFWHSGYRGGK